MSEKVYVIRRKAHKGFHQPVPESTYKPEVFAPTVAAEPIKASPVFEQLSMPKPKRSPPPVEHYDIKFQNPPAEFPLVDVRANKAVLAKDIHLLKEQRRNEEIAEKEKPTEFLEWQEKMRQADEEQRKEIIKLRHQDLDHCRKRAIKAKNEGIAARLEEGGKIREDIKQGLKQNLEVPDRDRILEIKERALHDPQAAVNKVRKQRLEATKEMKRVQRKALRDAAKLKEQYLQEKKDNALRIRTNKEGPKNVYREAVEITETKFLAALTEQEAQDIITTHEEQQKNRILNAIRLTKINKAKETRKYVGIMKELTEEREKREEAHVNERARKKEEAAKQEEERRAKEEEMLLKLDKKLEKKRLRRIKEAEEMEEHTREIAARNRYLALNKKALEVKAFQSQQDSQLRTTKDRQASNLRHPIKSNARKAKGPPELSNLKNLLGI